MKFRLNYGIPTVAAEVNVDGQTILLENVVVDSGSSGTVFAADKLAVLGIGPLPDDVLYTVHGVGETETVYIRTIERLRLGNIQVNGIDIEVGGMDYGFEIDGIVGTDFLV